MSHFCCQSRCASRRAACTSLRNARIACCCGQSTSKTAPCTYRRSISCRRPSVFTLIHLYGTTHCISYIQVIIVWRFCEFYQMAAIIHYASMHYRFIRHTYPYRSSRRRDGLLIVESNVRSRLIRMTDCALYCNVVGMIVWCG